jgi:hypothetical protein
VLQFRGEDFKQSFVNMGLSISSLAEGHEVVDRMLKIHVPKIVIMNADFWWFSSQIKELNLPTQKSLTAADTMKIAFWIYKGKISPKSMLKTIVSPPTGYGIASIISGGMAMTGMVQSITPP